MALRGGLLVPVQSLALIWHGTEGSLIALTQIELRPSMPLLGSFCEVLERHHRILGHSYATLVALCNVIQRRGISVVCFALLLCELVAVGLGPTLS